MESGRGFTRGVLPLLALHAVSEYYRLPWKPPVTAALVSVNTLVYLRPSFLKPFIPSIHHVYFNPYVILKNRDLKRFFLSPFYHINDIHLVYNMMSLLWKGVQLETSMGSVEFASMIAALLAMSQTMTLLLAKSFLLFFDYERPFYSEYAVGFSGVLFALKVVLNSRSDNFTYVHGLVVPSRHAAWAELILTQMFVPGVSFVGHLGGILAGILYLKLKGSYSGNDPLSLIIKGLTSVVSFPLKFIRNLFQPQRGRISGRGTVGGSQNGISMSGVWRCRTCTFDNSVLLDECEMCGTSQNDGNNNHYSEGLTQEEIRRRRIERFARR